jgi:NAD(P)H dehydrogenase (quinone)
MGSVDPHDISHLVVLGHPAPGSFCHAMADAYCESVRGYGQSADLRDLYGMGFDPLLKAAERPGSRDFAPAADVAAELDLIRASRVVTLVYPIWFGMPPAIIKGYVDRVLGAGFLARDIKAGVPHALLHGKRLVILSSSASTLPWLEEQGQWMALRQAFDTYLTTIFSLKGCEHVHFDAVVDGMAERRFRENLDLVDGQARKTCSEVLAEIHAAEIRAIREPHIM